MRSLLKLIAFCAVVAVLVDLFGDRMLWAGIFGLLSANPAADVLFR